MSRVDEVQSLAEGIAEDFLPVPISPEDVARSEGVTWSYKALGNSFDGLLLFGKRGFRIVCNTDRGNYPDSPRGRFTFCHELGHYFIDEHRIALQNNPTLHSSRSGWSSEERVEREADQFAAALLMPTSVFHDVTCGCGGLARRILKVCTEFQVSITSAAIRCLSLDSGICVVVRWDNGGKRSWVMRSTRARGSGLLSCSYDSIPTEPDFATRVAWEDGDSGGAEWRHGVTTGKTWFPFAKRDYIMDEVAIKLGKHGAITVLSERPT